MYSLRNVLKKVFIDRNDIIMLTRSKTLTTSNILSKQYIVQHDPNDGKFFINLNGDTAFVEYEKLGDIYNFYETQVPDAYRGKGIAKLLAQTVFDYAIRDNKKIQLSCTYLQKFYHENYEKYKNHVLDDDVEH